uniref:M.lini MldsB3 gene ORF1 and ORF2 n=1 Tax=Melampsora lini TaxID=5261 RepID=Q01211_MELLI|nr:unnamed protein product [Melampsora lini]
MRIPSGQCSRCSHRMRKTVYSLTLQILFATYVETKWYSLITAVLLCGSRLMASMWQSMERMGRSLKVFHSVQLMQRRVRSRNCWQVPTRLRTEYTTFLLYQVKSKVKTYGSTPGRHQRTIGILCGSELTSATPIHWEASYTPSLRHTQQDGLEQSPRWNS